MASCGPRRGRRLAAAQNLVITNARILDGTGRVIERGSVVVRDGKIVSVSAGTLPARPGAHVIDAQGRTVMPGFVDAHRHIIRGDGHAVAERTGAAAQMQEFLEAGFTTVVSAGDQPKAISSCGAGRSSGALKGPRHIAGRARAARAGLRLRAEPAAGARRRRPPRRPGALRRLTSAAAANEPAGAIPPAETIKAVEAVAKAGFDYIKTAIIVSPGGPEKETLKLIVSEGKKHNIPTITHAVTVIDTLAAVEAGPARARAHAAHRPARGRSPRRCRKSPKAGIPMTSTLAIFIPHFGEENSRSSAMGCRFRGTRCRVPVRDP